MSCTNGACETALGASNSLRQGQQFAEMTKSFHGGRSRRRSHRSRGMRGGAYASFPGEFSETLPQDMHAAANITSLDKAFAQLPEYAGKYGMVGGGRRTRRQRGGMAPIDTPGMILSAAEEGQAFLNPQWYNENLVNPNFRGPVVQKAGKRRGSRRQRRRGSRKHRRGSRRN